MRHYPRRTYRNVGPVTFYADTTIELSGAKGCGSSFDVEVEFTAEPDTFDHDTGCGDAGERMIIAIRAIKQDVSISHGADGVRKVMRERTYRDIPEWMMPYIEDCVDLNALAVDFDGDVDGYADDLRDRKRDEGF